MSKCVVVVQARLASKRLPQKVLAKLGDRTMLEQIVRRCKEARTCEAVIVACPIGDDVTIFEQTGIACIPGDETDLVSRLTNAVRTSEPTATHFVRVTADCPFVCPRLIEHVSWCAMNTEGAKVATNWKKRSFPDGLDLDCWDIDWLEKQDIKDREYFAQELIMGLDAPTVVSVENPEDLSKKYRLTVDYPEDLEMARLLYKSMGKRIYESQEVVSWLEMHPKVRKMNQGRVDGLFGAKQ